MSEVEVVRAARLERATLSNLLQLYLHDFSEILGTLPDEHGRFEYPYLALYWSDPARTPFLLKSAGRLAGFALVTRGSLISGDPEIFDMSEFFVVRGLRRRGVGRAAAIAVFRLLGGAWEVRVMGSNQGARAFWEGTISSFTGGRFAVEGWESNSGVAGHVFRFSVDDARDA